MSPSNDTAHLIEQSLNAVADAVGDPAPQVYQRLFELAPELEPLFIRDKDGSVRGEMLQRAFETILDLVGEGHYARGLIATEFVNHQNVGVPAGQFDLFFVAMIDAFKGILGTGWTADIDRAWRAVHEQARTVIAGFAAAA